MNNRSCCGFGPGDTRNNEQAQRAIARIKIFLITIKILNAECTICFHDYHAKTDEQIDRMISF